MTYLHPTPFATACRVLLMCALAGAVHAPTALMAQSDNLPEIENLNEQDREVLLSKLGAGRTFYENGQFQKALSAFQDAYELFPHPDVRYKIAECQEKLGRNAAAAASYEAFLEAMPDAPERKRIEGVIVLLKERAAKAARATVVITSSPEGALVSINGDARGATPLEVEVEQGDADVEISLEGYATITETMKLEGGETVRLRYPLSPSGAPDAETPGDTQVKVETEPNAGKIPAQAWIFTGAGAAALIGSGAMFLVARNANDQIERYDAQKNEIERPSDYNDLVSRRNTLNVLSASTLGLGLICVGVGTYYFMRTPDTQRRGATARTIAPVLGPDRAGVQLSWTF